MTNLHFIHGFLGFPSDWHLFKENFINYNCVFHSISHYMNKNKINENNNINDWASAFNSCVFSNKLKSQKNILIAYSLGGRLAMSALCKDNNWDAAILISANPGLKNEADKKTRWEIDSLWANRFLNEEWENVISDWNNQSVFANLQNNMHRDKNIIDKNEVAQMLLNFSLAKQEDLRDKLKLFSNPILYVAGEKDKKFVEIAKEVSTLTNNIKLEIVPNCAHRVPWENEKRFIEICLNFIKEI